MGTVRNIHREECSQCGGSGVCRNGRFFFYAISLIGSAAIMFLHWPPTPALFEAIHRLCWSIGLPDWIGSTTIWMFTAVPAIFGIASFYLWLHRDICPACEGSSNSSFNTKNREKSIEPKVHITTHPDARPRPEKPNHAISSSSR